MRYDKPYWVLRHHSPSPIRYVSFVSEHLALLAVGDQEGRISLTDLQTCRPRFFWKAHQDSILGVQALDKEHVVTHGRDNELHLWRLPLETIATAGHLETTKSDLPSTLVTQLPKPLLVSSIPVNALNFARFALLPIWVKGDQDNGSPQALVAVPHTLDAAYIDIIELPSGKRIHEAISKSNTLSRSGSRQPIIMSLRLFHSNEPKRLSCLAGYEDGYVKLWSHDSTNNNWSLSWQQQCHSESVMDLALSADLAFGVSVGADDRITKFQVLSKKSSPLIVVTKNPGKSSISLGKNDTLIAIGGWDANVRIHSSLDLQQLGTLRYHRDAVDSVSFFSYQASLPTSESDSDTDDTLSSNSNDAVIGLAAGGRDGKISLWHIL